MEFETINNEGETHNNPWTTLQVQDVYNNPWIRVTHRDVLNPAGKPGIYGVVHFKNLAIGIIPIDKEGNTWLVGQYRYTLERYSWEIPEGGGLLGTDPLEAAKRELLEETGIRAGKWTEIIQIHLSNSVSDEAGIAYVAQNLEFGDAQPEETEQLQVRKVPFSKVLDMVMGGQITDALSVCSVLKVNEWIKKGLISL
jgi:8-oxo-dGTP pyrophosphatase MutT (NUDIX family)